MTDPDAQIPPRPRERRPRGRLGAFLRRRRNRVLGYGVLGALIGLVLQIIDSALYVTAAWHPVANAPSGEFLFELKWFLISFVVPNALITAVIMAVGLILGGLIGFGFASLLPRRLHALSDGATLGLLLALSVGAIGLDPWIASLPTGPAGKILLFWLLFLALSGIVWDRLPLGFALTTQASRDVDLSISAVRTRLFPGRDPGTALADRAMNQGAPLPGDGFKPVDGERHGPDRLTLREPKSRAPWRVVHYHLRESGPGRTKIDIEVELNSLSPMAIWEIWTRPYVDDFADHLVARLMGDRDRSLYGAMLDRARRRLERRAGRSPSGAHPA